MKSDAVVNSPTCAGGVVRLDCRIIDFADVLVSVRAMLVWGFARPRKPRSSGVETPAMVAWTSSSGIPVQALRTDMVAGALAVRRRRWRRQGAELFNGRSGAGVFLECSGTHSANCAEDRLDSSGAVLGGLTVEVSDSVHRRRVLPQRQDSIGAVLGQFVLRLRVAAR